MKRLNRAPHALAALCLAAVLAAQQAPRTFALANGLRAVLVEDHSLPLVSVLAYVPVGGTPTEFVDAPRLLNELTQGGGGRANAQVLQHRQEALGIELRGQADPQELWVFLRARSRDQEDAVDILAERLLRPEQGWRGLSRRSSSSGSALLSRILAGDPRGETKAMADQPCPLLDPSRWVVALKGDLDLEQAKQLLNQHLGTWAKPVPVRPAVPPPAPAVPMPPGIYQASDLASPQIFFGTILTGDPEERAAQQILSRCLAETPGLNLKVLQSGPSRWIGAVPAGTEPDQTVLHLQRALAELQKKGIPEVLLNRVKSDRLQELRFAPKDPATELIGIARAALGLAPWEEAAAIQALKAADIHNALQKDLGPDSLRILVLGDAPGLENILGPVTPIKP